MYNIKLFIEGIVLEVLYLRLGKYIIQKMDSKGFIGLVAKENQTYGFELGIAALIFPFFIFRTLAFGNIKLLILHLRFGIINRIIKTWSSFRR